MCSFIIVLMTHLVVTKVKRVVVGVFKTNRFRKSDLNYPVFGFQNWIIYPVNKIRIIRTGFRFLKLGIQVGYRSRFMGIQIPAFDLEFFKFFLEIRMA